MRLREAIAKFLDFDKKEMNLIKKLFGKIS